VRRSMDFGDSLREWMNVCLRFRDEEHEIVL
jgi:hypothetical protein